MEDEISAVLLKLKFEGLLQLCCWKSFFVDISDSTEGRGKGAELPLPAKGKRSASKVIDEAVTAVT